MPTKTDDKSTASWLRRGLAEGATLSGKPCDPDTMVDAHAGSARDGWDPHEVWLRHIERPPRLRQRSVQSE